VIVIDRLVVRPAGYRTDDRVGGIGVEWHGRSLLGAAEVAIHRFTDEQRQRYVAPPGLVTELAIRRLREAQVGRDQSRHRDTTISRYFAGVKADA